MSARTTGTARLTVPAPDLVRTLLSLPNSYAVIGSEASRHKNTVVLLVASTDLALGAPDVVADVSDAGSTRTVRVVPARG